MINNSVMPVQINNIKVEDNSFFGSGLKEEDMEIKYSVREARQNEAAINNLLKSEDRKEELYKLAVNIHEDGLELENECAGLIDFWNDDEYVRYALSEIENKLGLPSYWIIKQSRNGGF